MEVKEEQIQFFKREGWLVLENFWEEHEMEAMRRELSRLKDEGKFINIGTDGDGVTRSEKTLALQLIRSHKHSDLFKAVPFTPKVVNTVETLIGSPAVLNYDQLLLKPAYYGQGTAWHQDMFYFNISDPMKGIAMWTTLQDANASNGTIRLIPKSFSEMLPHDRDLFSDHQYRCWPDETNEIIIEIKAGGVILFCYGTPHSTGNNTTAQDRAALALHFIHADYCEGRNNGPVIVSDAETWNNQLKKSVQNP